MKKYEKKIADRKVLVERLKVLTGQDAFYTRVPRCAYEVGPFTVEKDGVLTVEEGADAYILQTLMEEDLIGGEIDIPMPRITVFHADPVPGSVTPAIALGTTDWEPGDTDDGIEEDADIWRPESDALAYTPVMDEADPIPDAEYEQEAEEESAASLGVQDADRNDPPDTSGGQVDQEMLPSEPVFPMDASISLPLTNHTVTTLKNLICLVYARGEQISKATGGEFLIEKELVDAILDEASIHTSDQLREFLAEYERENGDSMQGFHIGKDCITFDGFTGVPDSDHLETFKRLAVAMNRMALTQKRIQAKNVDTVNEKYALRIWLIRLGFNGDQYKHDRKILMEKLSGHTAFRTQAEAERAKEKAIRKRDALRAAKAAAGTEGEA